MKCPGQDTLYWQPGDIFETPCPNCGRVIEFFKDDASRRCKGCGAKVLNPKLDFGCAEHCAFADQCLAGAASETIKQRAASAKENAAHENDESESRKEKGE